MNDPVAAIFEDVPPPDAPLSDDVAWRYIRAAYAAGYDDATREVPPEDKS